MGSLQRRTGHQTSQVQCGEEQENLLGAARLLPLVPNTCALQKSSKSKKKFEFSSLGQEWVNKNISNFTTLVEMISF